MFLFNSSHGNDPISFPDHPFFNFPSPFDDDGLLLQHQPFHETPSTFVNLADAHGDLTTTQKKKGSAKRDRHSKINTLRGPRDRRMRLSLPVAREFFGLQDLLGVDKASKTVEWLLFQARHAIKKLSRDDQLSSAAAAADARSASSETDGEVVSGIDENKLQGSPKIATTKEKRGKITRKTAFHPLAREIREKARARARARTQEKNLQICQTQFLLSNEKTKPFEDISKISSSWSTQIETNDESAGTQIEDQPISSHPRGMFDDQDESLMIMGRWSPSNSIYPSLQNSGILQEHPLGDLQFFGKPWEAYNNHRIC